MERLKEICSCHSLDLQDIVNGPSIPFEELPLFPDIEVKEFENEDESTEGSYEDSTGNKSEVTQKYNIGELRDKVLLTAVRQGNLKAVEDLLKEGADVFAKGANCKDSMQTAIETEDTEMVKLIIESWEDSVNGSLDTFVDYLWEVYQNGSENRLEILEMLLKRCTLADVQHIEETYVSPVTLATRVCAHWKCIEVFIKHGFDVNGRLTSHEKYGKTPLYMAAERGDEDLITLLLESGADILCYCEDGKAPYYPWTTHHGIPFTAAIHNGHTKVAMKKLIPSDMYYFQPYNLNESSVCDEGYPFEGFTIIHYICFEGNSMALRLLIAHKADVSRPTNQGFLPIQAALMGQKQDIVQELLRYTDLSLCDWTDTRKLKATVTSIFDCRYGHIKADLLGYMLKSGADLNQPLLNEGLTPLMSACWDGDFLPVKTMLQNGCDPNIVQEETLRTALWYAVFANKTRNVKLLLDTKADMFLTRLKAKPHPNYYYYAHPNPTVMQGALQRGNVDIITMLVQAGCYMNHTIAILTDPEFEHQLPPQIYQMLVTHSNVPDTLIDAAKCAVRGCIGYVNVATKINTLPIPVSLQRFLLSG